jgi:hypothetical protein
MLIEVVQHEDGVEAGRFGLLGLRDHGGEQLGDAGAVGEVGDLKSEFDYHEGLLIERDGIAPPPTYLTR